MSRFRSFPCRGLALNMPLGRKIVDPRRNCGPGVNGRRHLEEATMRYFLDAEFNGFGGDLISIALAPEDRQAAAFYEALPCAKPEPWVIERVLPVLQKPPISRPEATRKLAEYLRGDAEPVVISDWPEDIAHLALLMVTSPGRRLALPRLRFELLDLPLFHSETLSETPHNARCDAIALRDYVLDYGVSAASERSPGQAAGWRQAR